MVDVLPRLLPRVDPPTVLLIYSITDVSRTFSRELSTDDTSNEQRRLGPECTPEGVLL